MTDTLRTQKVGSLTMKVNRLGPTSAGRSPLYAICSPDRWGMRYSDEDKESHGNLVYPVARDYAKAVQKVLLNVQWGDAYFGNPGSTPTLKLTWPMNRDAQKSLFALVNPIVTAALTSPAAGFGIPSEAVPTNMGFYTPGPHSVPGEQGVFISNDWSLNLNINELEPIFEIKNPAPPSDIANRSDQLGCLRKFADTLYHEARHCQQWFWVFAFVQQHTDNFPTTPNIAKWPRLVLEGGNQRADQPLAMVDLAAKQPIPSEPTALVSLKRHAIGLYVYTLAIWRANKIFPSFAPDADALNDEFDRARASAAELLQHVGIGGTAIDVDAMVATPFRCYCDYTSRPWENDAFVCGEMATAYWTAGLGLPLTTHAPDQCSRSYEHAVENQKKASAVLAAMAAVGNGSNGTAGNK
ncbi:hypothetical protein [Caballeronia grimmiae]|uniref:hypothetical protein n=1 Tax=Caballeronia grimmiae TaxID=1071679 RepID=UPI0038BAB855